MRIQQEDEGNGDQPHGWKHCIEQQLYIELVKLEVAVFECYQLDAIFLRPAAR